MVRKVLRSKRAVVVGKGSSKPLRRSLVVGKGRGRRKARNSHVIRAAYGVGVSFALSVNDHERA